MQRSAFLTAVFSLFLIGLTGCGAGGGIGSTTARVRVIHASPDAPAVDVLVDGNRVVSGASYRAATDYLFVNAGTRNIRVNVANSNTSVININPLLQAGSAQTILAVARVASISPLVVADDLRTIPNNQTRLRLIHAASGVANVDIYVTAPSDNIATTNPTLRNIPFRAVSGYLTVSPGSYRVRITPTGTKTVAIDTGTVNLQGGLTYTGVAIGDPGVGRAPQALLLTDR